jgi:hypothetical protein
MQTTLPEDITKNLEITKKFFGKNIDFTLNNVDQSASQTKDVILERTRHSVENISQVTENVKSSLTKAVGDTFSNATETTSHLVNDIATATVTLQDSLYKTIEKIDGLNQTLSDGIQTSINSSLNSWIEAHPRLAWLTNHPLQGFFVLLVGIFLFSGLLKAISDITAKFWLLILTYPFKLISSKLELISKPFQKSHEKAISVSEVTTDQQKLAVILNRLESIRQEQDLLLQEVISLLKSESMPTKESDLLRSMVNVTNSTQND